MSLYPYQREGATWLSDPTADELRAQAAYLADGMGLGKSAQAATAARWCRDGIGSHARILVAAPASAIPNWQREWEKWFDLGIPRSSATFLSYGALNHPAWEDLYDVVIADEAHYAKNPGAQRTLKILKAARRAGRAMLLSGTPMPNHPEELWAPIRSLWPEIPEALGIDSRDEWIHRFCLWRQTRYGRRIYAAKNLDQLRPYLQRIMLRRTVDDIGIELPPLRVDLSLLPRDKHLDEALREAGIDAEALVRQLEFEDEAEEGSFSRLRRLVGELKAPAIAKQLDEELTAGEYDQIVVLAYHRSVLETLRHGLRKHKVVGFDGSTPVAKRQEAIDAFTRGDARVFVGQQTAAGVAINLQSSTEIALVEPAPSPDDNRQAIKRIHRLGSTRPVRARVFAVAGTLDEAVMSLLVQKSRMQEAAGLR